MSLMGNQHDHDTAYQAPAFANQTFMGAMGAATRRRDDQQRRDAQSRARMAAYAHYRTLAAGQTAPPRPAPWDRPALAPVEFAPVVREEKCGTASAALVFFSLVLLSAGVAAGVAYLKGGDLLAWSVAAAGVTAVATLAVELTQWVWSSRRRRGPVRVLGRAVTIAAAVLMLSAVLV